MIGHAQIIAARQRGLKPQAIFINAGYEPIPARFRFEDHEQAIDHGLYPTVTIPETELGRRQDLRFAADCQVHLHGKELSDAVLDIADTLAQAGARLIMVCCDHTSELMIYSNGQWGVYAY